MQAYAHYLDRSFDHMRTVLRRLDDVELNTAPFGTDTLSVAALITHCAGVSGFWLGHVGLGRPTSRDRDAEMVAEATRLELGELVDRSAAQARADVAELDGGGGVDSPLRSTLFADGSDDDVVLHVMEELFQHVGHMELTADALEHRRDP